MSAAGLTGAQACRWIADAVAVLEEHRSALDTLNVLPVPDADTGSNLHLTLRDAAVAARTAHAASADDGEVLAALTRGALVGARGSSGVIVGQYLAALLGRLAVGGGAVATAEALAAAARAARSAVAEPLEGTVLTVADEVARRAAGLARTDPALSTARLLAHAVAAGVCALPGTRETHPVLRAAGVPDAGAWGLLLVLAALVTAVTDDEELDVAVQVPPPSGVPEPSRSGEGALPGGEFEVMFLEESVPAGRVDPPGAADALRAALSDLGDSVALVTADGAWQAHVHTDRPADVLALPVPAGRLRHRASVRHLVRQTAVHGERRPPLGVVAITGAPGLVADLARAGAVVLVEQRGSAVTGQEVARAATDTGAAQVLVLGAGRLPDLLQTEVSTHVRAELREGGVVAAAAAALEASGGAPGTARPSADAVLLAVERAVDGLQVVEVELPEDHGTWAALVADAVLSSGLAGAALVRVLVPEEPHGSLGGQVADLVAERGGPACDVVVLPVVDGAPMASRRTRRAQVTVEPEP